MEKISLLNEKEYFINYLNPSYGYNKLMSKINFSQKTIKRSDETIVMLIKLLTNYKKIFITEQNAYFSKWFEVLVCGIYLYYHTYNDKKPITSLFEAREKYSELGLDLNINPQELDFIFRVVESIHDNSKKVVFPALNCATPESPTELVSLAAWLIKNKKTLYK